MFRPSNIETYLAEYPVISTVLVGATVQEYPPPNALQIVIRIEHATLQPGAYLDGDVTLYFPQPVRAYQPTFNLGFVQRISQLMIRRYKGIPMQIPWLEVLLSREGDFIRLGLEQPFEFPLSA